MIETNKPDFFIVGAAKSGTTSLYHYLNQHPEIYLSPIKEPNFFSSDIKIENLRQSVKNRIKAENIDQFFNDGMKRTIHRAFIRDEHQYLQLFAPAAPGQLKGEASPSYLYSEVAAKSIFAFNEKAKIIIILREPSSRAYSHYKMDLKLGFTQDSFKLALEKDKIAFPKGWGSSSLYIELGQYYLQVKRYLDLFPKENVLILLQKDLYKKKEETLKTLFQFLQVKDDFVPIEPEFRNESVVPANRITSFLLKSDFIRIKVRNFLGQSKLKKYIVNLLYKKSEFNNEDEQVLQEIKKQLKEDVMQLSKLINRNLDEWQK